MDDYSIPSSVQGEEMRIRVFTPAEGKHLPMILDIHGGGFVSGSIDIDNQRCIDIAAAVGCIVATVEYHLAGKEHHFPTPLMDCFLAYEWLQEHAEKLGGDPERMGLHGSSAGGTLCSGLALYLRDHGKTQPCLTVLNCACFTNAINDKMSYHQCYELRMGPDQKDLSSENTYLGGYDGTTPSYYAFPIYCRDLGMLKAHFIIAAEYDTLRDSSWEYARRLLDAAVPCEMLLAPRVAHCFTAVPHFYTTQIVELMATSYRREFGML